MVYRDVELKLLATKAFLLRLLLDHTEPEFAELRDKIRRFIRDELGEK